MKKTRKRKGNKKKFRNKHNKSHKKKIEKVQMGGKKIDATILSDIIDNVNYYSTFYIAIGAKYIDPSMFDYPIPINTGKYQLVPDFLTNDYDYSKKLIIIIDTFTPEELIINDNVMRSMLELYDNIDYMFINSLYNIQIQEQLLQIVEYMLPEQSIYVCNYVYFFAERPNVYEIKERDNVDSLLNNLLLQFQSKFGTTSLPKNKNIYKWFGKPDPNYICISNLYDITMSFVVPILKKKIRTERDNMTLNRFLDKNILRITPSYLY